MAKDGQALAPCRAAAVGEELDADVAVACNGRACAHQRHHDHQEDGDFLGPGKRLVREVAHHHVGKGNQRQDRHQPGSQPVFDGQRHAGARLGRLGQFGMGIGRGGIWLRHVGKALGLCGSCSLRIRQRQHPSAPARQRHPCFPVGGRPQAGPVRPCALQHRPTRPGRGCAKG
jgi:hypothetical protein